MAIDIDPNLSPYLQGNYAPVHDELDVADLDGHRARSPRRSSGTYLRNGANQAFAPIGRYHLFDGDGMIHGVDRSRAVGPATATATSRARACRSSAGRGGRCSAGSRSSASPSSR